MWEMWELLPVRVVVTRVLAVMDATVEVAGVADAGVRAGIVDFLLVLLLWDMLLRDLFYSCCGS